MSRKMKIKEHKIPVRKVFEGYVDSAELGVRGYGGRLNIRPAYQREFVYKPAQRDAVIETVRQGFPLNVMYWVRNGEGGFEMLDGQQRTLSICQYVNNEFSIDHHKFENLTEKEQDDILDYKLTIYVCEGEEREKLKWFEVVNTAGEQLNAQERRNAQYTGKWLYEAKKHFSKKGCAAVKIADKLLNGSAIRQDFLETALTWVADRDGGDVLDYMSAHQHDADCADIWNYFESVIKWVKATFPVLRSKLMKGLPWGIYYNRYGSAKRETAGTGPQQNGGRTAQASQACIEGTGFVVDRCRQDGHDDCTVYVGGQCEMGKTPWPNYGIIRPQKRNASCP